MEKVKYKFIGPKILKFTREDGISFQTVFENDVLYFSDIKNVVAKVINTGEVFELIKDDDGKNVTTTKFEEYYNELYKDKP